LFKLKDIHVVLKLLNPTRCNKYKVALTFPIKWFPEKWVYIH